MQNESLTLFYDGYCPLCVKEMTALATKDKQQKLDLEDVHQEGFAQRFPEINTEAALTMLHGYLYQNNDKRLVTGLDVTYHAWRLVGRGWMIAPLRWSAVKWLADQLYLWFARNRFTLSKLLTGRSRCERCQINRRPISDD